MFAAGFLPGAVPPLQEAVFVRRARLEDANEVLERSLTCGDRFRCADRVGDVAFEFDAAGPGLGRDRQVGVMRHPGLNLDEVDAPVLEHADGLPPELSGRRWRQK